MPGRTDIAASQRAPGRLPGPFRRYLVSQALSMFGSSFTIFAMPLLVFRITGSAGGLALAMMAAFLPYLLFGLIAGALADRLDRGRVMLTADLARMAILIALPLVDASVGMQAWMLYAAAFCLTSLGIAFDTCAFAVVPNLVGADQLVRANGMLQTWFSAAQLIGPALAGLAVAVLPLSSILLVDATSFLVSALALASTSLRRHAGPARQAGFDRSLTAALRSVRRDVAAGLRYVWSHPVLRAIAILMSLVNFLDATVLAQLIFLAKTRLGASNSEAALLFAAGNAGVLLLSPLAGRLRDRWSFGTVAVAAQIGCGLSILGLGLARHYWLALGLWAAYSGLGALFNINAGSLRQAIVPDELRGRVMSTSSVLAWSSIPVGALAGGALIEAIGDAGPVYAGIGALTALLTLAFAAPLGRPARSGLPDDSNPHGAET